MPDQEVAFVAMKFDNDSWRDKRYLAIRDVLEEAGYKAVRGDDLKSSGAAMTEVAEQLEKSAVVVIDISGGSHNVTYELGYCHGIGRDPSSVILLCRDGENIPFNYAHFRHLRYTDTGHLRRLLRHRLDITTPLKDDQTGYGFPFRIQLPFESHGGAYGIPVAEALLATLRGLSFSGRCEVYAGSPSWPTSGDSELYVIGLGLKWYRPKLKPDGQFNQITKALKQEVAHRANRILLIESDCEVTEMRGVRASLAPRGVAEFSAGKAIRLLSAASEDSWFSASVIEDIRNMEGLQNSESNSGL